MKLKEKLKKIKKREAVWKGPEVDGVSQSLISSFLVCRERFRVRVIEGLRPHERFSRYLHYGQMWHTCEEAGDNWEDALFDYSTGLAKEFPESREDVDKWYSICKRQYPTYLHYWKEQPDVKTRKILLPEVVFKVPYELPSGRVVFLRGRWDSVDLIGNKNSGIYLQENKTKGKIEEQAIAQQLRFDLQTMTYLAALKEYQTFLKKGSKLVYEPKYEKLPGTILNLLADKPIRGVRYNVIRRPLSGGKGTIRQKQGSKNVRPETKKEYYNRLREYFREDPDFFFMRWKVKISDQDIRNFKRKFLDPCLEHICLWYDYQTGKDIEEHFYREHFTHVHYQLPYGIYNSVMEKSTSDVDEYLLSGSMAGLTRVDNLFPEL